MIESNEKPSIFLNPAVSSTAKIVFSKIPNFEFLTQRFKTPGISSNVVNIATPYGSFNRPGDTIIFQKPWNLEIILDEKHLAYKEIYNWVLSYLNQDIDPERDFSKIVTDARIIVFDNINNLAAIYRINDVYPISISEIGYAINNTGIEYIKFNVDFEYSTFDIVEE